MSSFTSSFLFLHSFLSYVFSPCSTANVFFFFYFISISFIFVIILLVHAYFYIFLLTLPFLFLFFLFSSPFRYLLHHHFSLIASLIIEIITIYFVVNCYICSFYSYVYFIEDPRFTQRITE